MRFRGILVKFLELGIDKGNANAYDDQNPQKRDQVTDGLGRTRRVDKLGVNGCLDCRVKHKPDKYQDETKEKLTHVDPTASGASDVKSERRKPSLYYVYYRVHLNRQVNGF